VFAEIEAHFNKRSSTQEGLTGTPPACNSYLGSVSPPLAGRMDGIEKIDARLLAGIPRKTVE